MNTTNNEQPAKPSPQTLGRVMWAYNGHETDAHPQFSTKKSESWPKAVLVLPWDEESRAQLLKVISDVLWSEANSYYEQDAEMVLRAIAPDANSQVGRTHVWPDPRDERNQMTPTPTLGALRAAEAWYAHNPVQEDINALADIITRETASDLAALTAERDALVAEIAEAKRQAAFAWERHAEKDRAYGAALAERDTLVEDLKNKWAAVQGTAAAQADHLEECLIAFGLVPTSGNWIPTLIQNINHRLREAEQENAAYKAEVAELVAALRGLHEASRHPFPEESVKDYVCNLQFKQMAARTLLSRYPLAATQQQKE